MKLVQFMGRHDGSQHDICIYDLPAWAYQETREVADELAKRIEADFGEWFSVKPKPAPKAEKTPVDPAKE